MKLFKKEKKKPVFRAIMDCQYSDGQHVKQIFKAGEALPEGWETGHPGWGKFKAEDNVMSQERKLKEKASKYNA